MLPTTLLSYSAATVVCLLIVLTFPGSWSTGAILWGIVAGLSAVVGFACFYAAVAAGPITLVAPLIAVLGSAVPVFGALATGSALGAVSWVGIGIAVAGAGLISFQPGGSPSRPAASGISVRTGILSVVAGVTLGLSLIALDRAPSDSGPTTALVELLVGLLVLLAVYGASRGIRHVRVMTAGLDGNGFLPTPGRSAIVMGLTAGALLGIGNTLILAALQSGDLAIVSVLAGLYPIVTISLAAVVMRERIAPLQMVGVVFAIAASLLLAFGSA